MGKEYKVKDFILILIMCGAFVAFISGLVYVHISGINEKIRDAYEKGYIEGYNDGFSQNDTSIEQALLLEVIDKCMGRSRE